ncbi:SLC26A/SulP transporter family protein [Rhodoplanes sp. Z2-YC6860]|uniref:SLC26A/SulP transporter family protein n=1 Tax=Rhodoplanes sp. Z2-YC6860 TaxID=674703 RepID=UPI00078DEE59|nr:SulP family inorganic anion transporter [Rhodoplanes sp. Z2-YC6860]AMN39239.1 sulfate permease-like transporter, MFS superfamily [Rhodoplanes sp. Z2-YC6860]
MSIDSAVGDSAGASQPLRGALRDMLAGAICSVLSIAYCLSYAALIFSGPLSRWLSYGIAVTFLSAAIAAAVVAWRSSLPFAIAGPDTSTSAVTATLVAAMMTRLSGEGTSHLLEPALIVMALGTAVTGIVLCVLGMTRAGRAIRFVPYPVIGGFLGATGVLMIMGAIQVITDQRLTLASAETFLHGQMAAKVMAGIAVAAVLRLFIGRSRSPYILPAVLLAAVAVTQLVILLTGSSPAEAKANGWTFHLQSAASLHSPWQLESLRSFPWATLPWLAGDLLAVMFVTTISLLLNTTGVEIATKREANIERELNALGIACLCSSALGGFVSCLSLSRTTLNNAAGATGRLSGLTLAAISAAMLVVNPDFLGYVPKFALGGLLFFAGWNLCYRWLIHSVRQLQPLEYLSLLAIALIIVSWGFIAGVMIGIVIGCATFALSVSRVNAIKFSFDGSEYRSSLDRSPTELALLARHGREIQGVALQSYLFFGSANRLYEYVKSLLAQRSECRFLLFDLRLVTGIDSSATHSFSQIKDAAAECGARLVLVNLTAELERPFRIARFITDDVIIAPNLDRALESCEQAVIDVHRADGGEARSLHDWLTEALGSSEHADMLVEHCRRLEVPAGETIARQGEPSDSMHFILEGRVGVIVDLGEGHTVRVRSLGRHTTIGEMGLITGRPRSAAIQAEIDSVLYELSADDYRRIKEQRPALGQALLSYVIAVMAERLSFASRAIGVLQR